MVYVQKANCYCGYALSDLLIGIGRYYYLSNNFISYCYDYALLQKESNSKKNFISIDYKTGKLYFEKNGINLQRKKYGKL